MIDIVQDGDPVLREKAKEVPEEMFGTEEFEKILFDMETALHNEPNGVALAAPQIGISYRIFIVRYDRLREDRDPSDAPEVGIYINPTITKLGEEMEEMDEGCLSKANIFGKTVRHSSAVVRAQDENGNWFRKEGRDILAQVFQHETDHLEGVLFIDHAKNLVTVANEQEN